MRLALLLPVLVLIACSSRESGGTLTQQPIAACPVVVLPIGDAQRRHVRVFGTGAPMTAAVVAELKRRGFTPAVPEHDDDASIRAAAATADAKLMLATAFSEWEPDLRLDLQIAEIDTGALLSEATRVIGSNDRKPAAARADELAQLAHDAIERLVNPPPKPTTSIDDDRGPGLHHR